MHLAAIIVEFSIRSASQPWYAPAAGITVLSSLAVPPVNGHDPLAVKISKKITNPN